MLLWASLVSCQAEPKLTYDVQVRNRSTQDLDGVLVTFPEFYRRIGALPKGVEKGEGEVVVPFPSSLMLEWHSVQAGSRRLERVAVPQELPPKYPEDDYQLILEITDRGAIASIEIDDTASSLRRMPEDRNLYAPRPGS